MKLRLVRRPVVIVGKALSDKNTTESMWIDGPGSAVNTLSQKWATTLRGKQSTAYVWPLRLRFCAAQNRRNDDTGRVNR